MLLSLFSGATGMQAQQLNLNVIANNLANVTTNGFKRSKIEFQDLLYQTPRTVGAQAGGGELIPTGIEMGNGSQVVSTTKVFSQGTLTQTGGTYDVAIQGNGFFEVQQPNGTIAYTRDGSFTVSSNGTITTSDGLPVLSGFQSVPAGTTSITIDSSGDMTATTATGSSTSKIQLANFTNPGGLLSLGGNLYAATPSSGVATLGTPGVNGFGTLSQGYLETSNVNIVNEMVNMITAQRAYEINSKSVTTSDEMLKEVAQLKQ